MPLDDARNEELEQRIEAMRRLVIFGEEIKQRRHKLNLSLRDLADKLNEAKSANYISELERGVKNPSDHMVRQLADTLELDEGKLFELLGRIPLLAREEIQSNKTLQRTLSEIGANESLTDDQKHELYDKIYDLYKSFVDELD